ncbi:MAG: hypothetical protein ACQEV7_11440 [Bacillota bacterium]
MKKRKIIGTTCLTLSLLTLAGISQAAVSHGYSETVGKFNGSAYTYYYKNTEVHNIELNSYTVGGDYTVDARPQIKDWTTYYKWATIDDWQNVAWQYPFADDGGEVRIQFSNDLSTPVNVNVTGRFSPG